MRVYKKRVSENTVLCIWDGGGGKHKNKFAFMYGYKGKMEKKSWIKQPSKLAHVHWDEPLLNPYFLFQHNIHKPTFTCNLDEYSKKD